MTEADWFLKTVDETTKITGAEPETGLGTEEAGRRLTANGPNALSRHKKKSLVAAFFGHLNDPLIYVLLGAVVITVLMGEYLDGIIIVAVVLLNAILGLVQEVRAESAIEALKKLASPKALVKRNGEQQEVLSESLVVGDIVILDAGRYVPADLRLIETVDLKIDESALTGESVAVDKDAAALITDENAALGDRVNMAYMSTLVTYGRGTGVVVEVAHRTEVGKIATIISEEEEVTTPLERKLAELGKTLGKIAVLICVIMFGIGFLQGRDAADMFLTAVSLAVASIPEGLAAIVAIVLSIGVTKMARRNAIIKKLPAVETLGSVNIVCSDKTGTLTQNKMTVTRYFTYTDGIREVGNGTVSAEAALLVRAMVLNSDATLESDNATGDPTEVALLMLADALGIERKELHNTQPRIDELAFDSDRKMMSTLHRDGESYAVYTKGAVDSLVLKCRYIIEQGKVVPLTETHRHLLLEAADEMSDNALRTLGAAYKTVDRQLTEGEFENELVMIGLVGMMDPPREEVKDSIKKAKAAGIDTVMITGDHKNTAVAIAKELGIAQNSRQAVTGAALGNMSGESLEDHVEEYRVFARVSPEHKVNIVKAFQAKGNIVSMTGDGVNDAPSLNAADIGVAMGITGTDVAKNASDMILADDNFSTIISAIEEGRNIYNNIKKSVVFLLSSNVGEVIAMLLAIVAGMPAPLIATQLLWINLLTDSLPAIALGLDPGSKDVMKEKPRGVHESFFAHGAVGNIVIGGISIGIVTIISYWLGFSEHGYTPFDDNVPKHVLDYARTLAFMTIIACQLFYAFSLRHPRHSIFKAGIFTNKFLVGAIIIGFLLQVLVLEVPALSEAFRLQSLHLRGWLEIMGLGLFPLVLNEIVKLFRKKDGKTRKTVRG